MADSSNPPHLPPEPTVATRGLSLLGLVLIVVYLTKAASVMIPVRLLNSAWQLSTGTTLLNTAVLPLIGLAMLHLAVFLDPLDPVLTRRLRPMAHLAVIAVVGYLLLIPLMGTAGLNQLRERVGSRDASLTRAGSRLEQLREAVKVATSVPDLESRMIALQGPRLEPADRLQPLAQLRIRVNEVLDRVEAELARTKASAPRPNPWVLLPNIARDSVTSLAFAIAFAGLAQRPGSEFSLLSELIGRFEFGLQRRQISRRNRAGNMDDQDYVSRLTDDQD
ncbi:MAG: hypothetical protein VKI42_02475 [Synechococcaceae cyanobacterium]|nr:hypothetical protein [Synechococcaceae cyanobacterium]